MYSTARIFCCWHPDWVIDETAEKGYRELKTGKWVVEWDELEKTERKNAFLKTVYKHKHFRKDFQDIDEAEKFMNKLRTMQKVFD